MTVDTCSSLMCTLITIVQVWCFTTYIARLHSRLNFNIIVTVSSLYSWTSDTQLHISSFSRRYCGIQRENTIPVFTDSFVHLSMYSANRNRVQSKVGIWFEYWGTYGATTSLSTLGTYLFGIYYKWCSMQLKIFLSWILHYNWITVLIRRPARSLPFTYSDTSGMTL